MGVITSCIKCFLFFDEQSLVIHKNIKSKSSREIFMRISMAHPKIKIYTRKKIAENWITYEIKIFFFEGGS